jgi:enoyl reductase-like protein
LIIAGGHLQRKKFKKRKRKKEMIKWTGKSTDKRWIKTVEAETYRELLENLIEKGYIGHYNDSDSQLFHELAYVSPEVEELEDRLNDEDQAEQALEDLENFDWDRVFENLTDQQFATAIAGCTSQAYYQEFEVIE